MIRRLAIGLGLMAWCAGPAPAEQLDADVSHRLVSIDSRFTGTEIVVFGARDGRGDVVVEIRGPAADVVVRRKARVMGLWINREHLTFRRAPSYYGVASSRPLDELQADDLLQVNKIGTPNLSLTAMESVTPTDYKAFRSALIRNKQRIDLYPAETGVVAFVGDYLFRTSFAFPANVPTGVYQADIYLIEDGRLLDTSTTQIDVRKTGFEDAVYSFAIRHQWGYGLLAVIGALMAGWLAGVIFRRS